MVKSGAGPLEKTSQMFRVLFLGLLNTGNRPNLVLHIRILLHLAHEARIHRDDRFLLQFRNKPGIRSRSYKNSLPRPTIRGLQIRFENDLFSTYQKGDRKPTPFRTEMNANKTASECSANYTCVLSDSLVFIRVFVDVELRPLFLSLITSLIVLHAGTPFRLL